MSSKGFGGVSGSVAKAVEGELDEEREEELPGPPVDGPASISKLKKSSRAVFMAKLDASGLSAIISTSLCVLGIAELRVGYGARWWSGRKDG